MSKAFECIVRNLLINELRLTRFPPYVVFIIECIMRNNWLSVKCNKAISSPWKAQRGICHKGTFSAWLFNFSIDDILKEISQIKHNCRLGLRRINIQSYANDLLMYCPIASGLRILIDRLPSRPTAHSLEVNA